MMLHEYRISEIVFAWLFAKLEHLINACKAAELKLSEEDVSYFEGPYLLHAIAGQIFYLLQQIYNSSQEKRKNVLRL